MISTLRIAQHWDRSVAVLLVEGSLDLAGSTRLIKAVGELAQHGATSIVCDLHELRDPVDSHLLTVFPAAQRRAGAWPHHALHLAGASASLSRRLGRLGIDRFLSVHGSVDDALRATSACQDTAYRDLELAPTSGSPALARRCLRTLTSSAPRPRSSWDGAELVVSELTTNAVRHVHRPFTVSLALAESNLLVGVSDDSRQEPIVRPVRIDSADGRGIQLIDALSQSWGVRLIHHGGKTVWARITPTAA